MKKFASTVIAFAMGAALVCAAAPANAAVYSAPIAPNTWKAGALNATTTEARYTFKPMTTAYYLVNVGDLSQDFALTITDTSGKRLHGSDRPAARAFEQVIRRFLAGTTYQIRVTNKNGASGKFVVRALALKPSASYVLDYTRVAAFSTANGSNANVVGRIVNNTDSYLQPVAPTFQYFRQDGQLLESSTVLSSVPSDAVPPHSIVPFSITHTPNNWHSAKLVGNTYGPSTSRRPVSAGVQVTSKTNAPDQYGVEYHDFTITNNTSSYVSGNAAALTWGMRGQLLNVGNIDGAGTNGSISAYPGESASSTVQYAQSSSQAVSFKERRVFLSR